ncbi:MAG: hypothetical protein IKT03_05105 [Muribaculaceae bacterium]|nr:hypothetical protein [Muribaculaceae bacterium]
MHKRLVAILIAMLMLAGTSAQELEWSVDMNAVFNNREGGNYETPAQTFIFTRITPQIGVSMDSTRHRIMGGVTWYQPMNDNLHGYKVLPALYYEYKNPDEEIDFKFGVIPNELNAFYPTYLRSDSINYVNPNIKGATIKISKPHFYFESWLDWRQIMTKHRREAFSVAGSIGWRNSEYANDGGNDICIGSNLAFNHLARSGARPDGEGVVDNVIINPSIVYTHWWHNASFSAEARMLLSCDRDRVSDNKWLTQAGFLGGVSGHWKWLSLAEFIYAGKRQMPLYEKYGSLLYQGDQFFHNKFYSSTIVAATIFNTDYLIVQARLSFHATDKTTAFWQQLAVRFYLDRNLWGKYKKKERRLYYSPLHPQF